MLSCDRVTKRYGGVTVLEGVSVEVRAGEVHALVGENGAGKSTLCRIMAGVVGPDEGSMMMGGKAYRPGARKEGEEAGVRMVMQELNLIPTLTVAENIYLGEMPRRLGVVNYGKMNRMAGEAVGSLGLRDVAPTRLVSSLGVGQAQLVEIAAALAKKCRVLILDEPTAALTGPEIELLFGHIQRLKEAGVGIVYVSHRMEELRRISDRITVLRDGKHVATRETRDLSEEEIIRLMVGRDLSAMGEGRPATRRGENVMLAVRELSTPVVKEVSFEVREGEIFGIAGLMGSGRTELLRAIFGADRVTRGEVRVKGEVVRGGPRERVRKGIALLTEDRKHQGLLLPLAIGVNATLAKISEATVGGGVLSKSKERTVGERFVEALRVRCRGAGQAVQELSGGNQQKVVLAKWLLRGPEVLLFDEPTRGVDVGAKFEIYNLLYELAEKGKALVVVSSDLLELMAIADRIGVMSAGRLVRTFERGEWTQEKIMEAALAGYRRTTDAA